MRFKLNTRVMEWDDIFCLVKLRATINREYESPMDIARDTRAWWRSDAMGGSSYYLVVEIIHPALGDTASNMIMSWYGSTSELVSRTPTVTLPQLRKQLNKLQG